MTLRIIVTDIDTGESDTAEIAEGDYLLITHKPCYEASVQTYPTTGTHVLTIKGHAPKRKATTP